MSRDREDKVAPNAGVAGCSIFGEARQGRWERCGLPGQLHGQEDSGF